MNTKKKNSYKNEYQQKYDITNNKNTADVLIIQLFNLNFQILERNYVSSFTWNDKQATTKFD